MSEPTELRQDRATRNWVIIAPRRDRRPVSFAPAPRPRAASTPCPFCPGREVETPPERWRLAGPDGRWRVRVVPNRFALLAGDGGGARRVDASGFVALPGTGRHEVVIESPDHDADLARSATSAVRDVLEAYRARYRALRDEGWACIVIFRNHGPGAGTSLAHPHSQIVATPVVPLDVRHRFAVAMRHFDDTGGCLYLELLGSELADGRRIVLERERVVAFQPFAAAVPFETWIMPREHAASFGEASDRDLDELAATLRAVLGGLDRHLGDPDYNLVVQSAPPGDEGRRYFVWHLRIVPRLATPAGFELGSGMPVNPSLPEETAAARDLPRDGAPQRGGRQP
jgi:UDPglucose--hexose-1-phosphate uridylyltransferase